MSDHVKTVGGESQGGVGTDKPLGIKDDQATSSSSDSSGDTLHDDGSSDIRSAGDGALSHSSPLSPNNLNFSNLTIENGDSRLFKSNGDRYSSPHHRGLKQYADSSPYGLPSRDFRRDGNNRAGTPYSGRGGGGGFRNSRTWMSPDAQAQQEFMVIRNAMRRLFKNSDIAKWKLSDYIAHRENMIASQASKLASQVKVKEEARGSRSPPIPTEHQKTLRRCGIEGNFNEQGNFGRVLGEQTIWCDDWQNGKDEIAPWPSMAEMKWEGDDRSKTGVGRFLPLPREEGPPTLPWNQLPVVDQYPMDQVAKIPTMEDVYLPVDDQIEPECEYLWSKELEEEMDAFLDS